jgi:hypothetical protein
MFSSDESTLKAFPVRSGNLKFGSSDPRGLFGNTQRKQFAKGDTDAPVDVVLVNGKLCCWIDGKRIELRHTREALAALRGR